MMWILINTTGPTGVEGAGGTCHSAGGRWRGWPDNEPTRRAKLAARTARGWAAAHGHIKQPRPAGHIKQPRPAGHIKQPGPAGHTEQPGTA